MFGVQLLGSKSVGGDFHFGRDRAGNAAALADFGREMGFGVTVVPLLHDGSGVEYSSTAIRNALAEGRMPDAERMLGHSHRIVGEVIAATATDGWIVTRGGASVGDMLVGEGLARRWEGQRRPWC